jgi:16S rRNA (guanine(966)-N(2))-methyltransferase RsmD
MRIIAGKARSRKITAPEGLHTRPVTDKIRESLFNIWQTDIYDANFLDLFSGSGCMGLEALSRGAANVVMVDNSKEAIAVIKQNLKSTDLAKEPHEVCQEDVFGAVKRLSARNAKFDIIYVDPPFTVDEIFYPVMEALAGADILAEDGLIAIRTLKEKEMPESFGRLEKYREKNYGLSTVHFYATADE